jgi:hypothetical protein
MVQIRAQGHNRAKGWRVILPGGVNLQVRGYMTRQIIRGALVGLVFAAATGVLPAHATLNNMKITHPTDGATVAGTTLVDFEVTSDSGLSWARLAITGTASSPGQVFEETSAATGRYGKSFSWVTTQLTPYNDEYTVTFSARENVTGQEKSDSILVRVSNPPATPQWAASPRVTNGAGGRKVVTLSWRANTEPDIREYRLTRVDPSGDEAVLGPVSAVHPDYQGCVKSSGVITCQDTRFEQTGYGGTYSYRVQALRNSPVPDEQCGLDTDGNPTASGGSCVSSSPSSAKSATLVEPKPTPTPKPAGTSGGSGTTPTTTVTSGPPAPAPVRTYAPGEDPREFYTGTYSPQLPYQPKTLLESPAAGGGGSSQQSETRVEATKQTRIVSEPLDARGKVLPVAGGLLAILAAAHVRRLLRDH